MWASDQSMALNATPAWATEGIATKTPETTKKKPAYSQPRTRPVITFTSLLGLTQELTRIRRSRDIRSDRAAGPLTATRAVSARPLQPTPGHDRLDEHRSTST